jgi:AcrR family transcriptional regulator
VPPPRQVRADAVRNREKIIAAAREQITRLGPDTAMDTIAAAAGVAVGTLYRHFPTKADLVDAIVEEHLEIMVTEVEAAAARARAGAEAWPQLQELARRFVADAARDQAIKAAAQALGSQASGPLEARVYAAGEELVAAAKAAGHLRPDASAADFALLIATAPADQPAAARQRWLDLFLSGLAAAPGLTAARVPGAVPSRAATPGLAAAPSPAATPGLAAEPSPRTTPSRDGGFT